MDEVSIFFAGTAGSVPTRSRGLPATLVRLDGDWLMFDCGEGTQRQLIRSVGLVDLDAIFITHFHADHWLGLPGLLSTYALGGREKPLAVLGPPGLRSLLAGLQRALGKLTYPLTVHELDEREETPFSGYRVAALTTDHRGRTYGYAVVEDERPGRFDAELATSLGVTPGPDFGRLQRGETIAGVRPQQVIGPARPGRKIVLSGDTRPCAAVALAAHRADVLVHEATFMQAEADRARQTGHSTAGQAAALAREAEVTLLALTHSSTRYPPRELAQEARAVFEPTVVPRDFDTIAVPVAERGKPALERWEEPAAPAG